MNPETDFRTELKRKPERDAVEETPEILASGLVAHVGFVIDGQPYVLPFTYVFDPAKPKELYLHGSVKGRAIQHLALGAPVCVEVSLVDGLVYSKTAFFHSMNYRSAVVFGRATEVTDMEEKRVLFVKLIERYFEGRKAPKDYESPRPEHLSVTTLLRLEIESWSAKARRGGPNGPHDKNPDAPGSAGVQDLSRPDSV